MELLALLVVVAFLLMLVLGIPVYAAMGLSAIAGLYLVEGSVNLLQNAAIGTFNSLSSFVLLAVPLYILAGTLLQQTGLSDRLFAFASAIVGSIRGGLAVATIVACSIFAAISGSSVATAATIGLVAIPALTRAGYPRGQAGALIAAGGTLGILIPPSIALLLFGVITDQSVGGLFVAGVVPGILLAVLMALYSILFCPKSVVRASGPAIPIGRAIRDAGPVLLLPVLIFVGIYTGIATPTEVAALAVAYLLVVGFATRTLGLRQLAAAGTTAMHSSVMILLLVAFGSLFTHFLTVTGVPQQFSQMVAGSGLGFFGTVTLMIVFYLILGMFLEALSMMLVTIPILYPVATMLGIHPFAFGIFVVLAIEVAQITPPVGINLFTISQVGKVPFESMARSAVPYVLLLIVMMYLVVYFQQIATWLPMTMEYGK